MISTADRRVHPRKVLSAPYTRIEVRPAGSRRFGLSGHVYDISAGGLRFELDQPLAKGQEIEIRVTLPNIQGVLQAGGQVVRVLEGPDEPGPARMGLRFTNLPLQANDLLAQVTC